MSANRDNICNLNRIYGDNYSYSLPRDILKTFKSGNAFDWGQKYTKAESTRLDQDIQTIWTQVTKGAQMFPEGSEGLIATISAGSPGVGKTTLMNALRNQQESKDSTKVPYICPDDVCLKNQANTYGADIEGGMSKADAYTKWRPGSNAINHIILGNLILGDAKGRRYPFYFGTTSISPKTPLFYEHLKKHGYSIRIIAVYAPDGVRVESIQERDKTFVQTSADDIVNKGLRISSFVQETLLTFPDELMLYYREAAAAEAQIAAMWKREEPNPSLSGRIEIVNAKAYEGIKTVHNTTREKLLELKQEPSPTWEEAFESTLVNPEALK